MIEQAPTGALIIAANAPYTRDIARKLGRLDLRIEEARYIYGNGGQGADRLRGYHFTAVLQDHAVRLDRDDFYVKRMLESLVRQ